MAESTWSDTDTERALQFWEEYLKRHDVSDRVGKTAGIDPESGRIWFGDSAKEIAEQMDAEGGRIPFYSVRVGFDYYIRKGGIGDQWLCQR